MADSADDAAGFAENLLALLDEGRTTATYKFAVLLALIDVCLEGFKAILNLSFEVQRPNNQ